MRIFENFAEILVYRPHLGALLFDLDGTLVDTMASHYRAYRDVLATYGGDLTKADFDRLSGPPANETIPRFVMAAGLKLEQLPPVTTLHQRKKENFAQSLLQDPPAILPSGEILLEYKGRMRIAVVTSGNQDGAQAVLRATGLDASVSVLVTGDDVRLGKPAPAPYLLALERLCISAENAVAFEDHDDGVRSATLAGLITVDVRNGKVITPDGSQ